MSARSKARKRALDILFEADQREVKAADVLTTRVEAADPLVNPHTSAIVSGVVAHGARIDELLSSYSHGWTLDRMPAVDRAILRIGVFEVLWADDVPDSVAISEAVAMATDLSTDESPSFVNGVLGAIAAAKTTLLT